MEPNTSGPASGLEALAGMARETDEANPSQEQQQEQQQQQQQATADEQGAREWGLIPYSIGGLLTMLEPALKEVYTEERCLTWGKHAHGVAKKYGWDGPSNLPEFALVLSTAGFAVPSFFLIRARLEQMRQGGATGLWAKVGVWWRGRKAAKAARAAADAERTVDAAG